MKMKEFGPPGGHTSLAPPRSANDFNMHELGNYMPNKARLEIIYFWIKYINIRNIHIATISK